MTQEDKELLLADLCARLPYRVKTMYKNIIMEVFVTSTFLNDMCCLKWDSHKGYYNQTHAHVGEFKLYLRPMSSMTEEEKAELLSLVSEETKIVCEQIKTNNCGIKEGKYHFNSLLELDWLNAHHFDYRGLIEKGLALEAPEGIYK